MQQTVSALSVKHNNYNIIDIENPYKECGIFYKEGYAGEDTRKSAKFIKMCYDSIRRMEKEGARTRQRRVFYDSQRCDGDFGGKSGMW